MQTSYISTSNPYDEKWINISDFFSYVESKELNVFYIGNTSASAEQLASHFQHGFTAKSLDEAKIFLQYYYLYNGNGRPIDVLVIDLPFIQKELERFCSFLKEEPLLQELPIVYHEKHLSAGDLQAVQKLNFVDDVIDIYSGCIDYAVKVIFMKRVKRKLRLQNAQKKKDVKKWSFKKFALFFKRVFDVVISGTAIIALSPVLIIIACLIKLESKGTVFYSAPRAGMGFKVFKFFKFRTMVSGADAKVQELAHLNQYAVDDQGPKFFKIANDPRITRLGKFLRNTSLDELPQLFNVFLGDMSIVGNRPLPIYEAITLTTNEFVERFSAPAGITGLWQIKKRGKSNMSTEERMDLDIYYARHCNAYSDFKILVNTPLALFQKTDA